MPKRTRLEGRILRQKRGRKKISGTTERPRMSVFFSNKQIYTQFINDVERRTLAATSTLDPKVREEVAGKSKTEAAKIVGKRAAEVAKEAGIETIVFDKSGFKYGQRLNALANAARKGGLVF